jgi:hypothetical protein
VSGCTVYFVVFAKNNCSLINIGCGNNAVPVLNTLEFSGGDLEVWKEVILRSRLKAKMPIPE